MPSDEVISACFKAYGVHLEDLEKRDLQSLKKRINELKSMQRNLQNDLQEADHLKTSLLQEREQDLIPNNYNTGERRGGVSGLQGQINSRKDKIAYAKERLLNDDQDLLQ